MIGPDQRAIELEHAWQKACRRWNFKETDKSGLSNYIPPRFHLGIDFKYN